MGPFVPVSHDFTQSSPMAEKIQSFNVCVDAKALAHLQNKHMQSTMTALTVLKTLAVSGGSAH